MNSQSAPTGCVLNGQVSIRNTSYNVFAISYTLEDCTGIVSGLTLN